MARKFSPLSIDLLAEAAKNPQKKVELFYQKFKTKYSKKLIYNTFYRMVQLGLLEPMLIKEEPAVSITREGEKILQTYRPTKDGVWKIIIYDIPESKRFIRTTLRARLIQLGFKKWQSSIWISPYALDPELEQELNQLAKKFFVRLIKTTQINITEDLENMFK